MDERITISPQWLEAAGDNDRHRRFHARLTFDSTWTGTSLDTRTI
jgi:hypothetical protein